LPELGQPALHLVAAAARRSDAGSRRTASSARRPRPSGRRHSGRGATPWVAGRKAASQDFTSRPDGFGAS